MILPVTGWFSRWGYTVYKISFSGNMTGIKKHYLQPPAKGISPPAERKKQPISLEIVI
jgi:hypothetical protein